jgi:hypothetical protein
MSRKYPFLNAAINSRKMAMAAVFGLMPFAAQSCEYLEPFDISQISGAELVIVGKVTGFQMLDERWAAALVTIEVEDALKGRAFGEVTFVWTGGMAMGPQENRAEGRVLVAAMKGGRIAVTDRVPDLRPDLPSIIQPYCGEVWMQPALPATVKAARKALE